MSDRKSGILLHISSLPSEFGIGDLGPGAYRFVDFLHKAKQQYWQILPINPTDPISNHSPYSSLAAFAANILFISPQLLVEEGIITAAAIDPKPDFSAVSVEYDAVTAYKQKILNHAYENFVSDPSIRQAQEKDFNDFVSANAFWLEDYALFVTMKDHFQKKIWLDWPEALRYRKTKALRDFSKEQKDELTRTKFFQYLFFRQWVKLKEYCADHGVRLFGDLAIYMNLDSADVWQHPRNYKLDDQSQPSVVAGVPPDYFSTTGQRWGNPVYNWDVLKKSRFSWWVERFRFNFQLFDVVRIDHFRGLVQFWEIPAHETTAVNGQWADVPTNSLFKALEKSFSTPLPIIAEDLGYITEDVRKAMRKFGFPGMKILLFAFNGDLKEHPYLPHNYKDDCVVYTGTHDNNTVLGWFENEASDDEINNIRQYTKKKITSDSICWDLIHMAFYSAAEIAMIPMQDLLGLGEEARMNKPGTSGNENWRWRLLADGLSKEVAGRLADITAKTGRA
ncbi:MAG: 4-alpha-glucanotransferase [Candidatus Omnitrophica bacterium]|nr:4-alpha-glucanotransferase [Candidatus Omnitrophota bacterium]